MADDPREITARARATLARMEQADREHEIEAREHRLADQFCEPPNPSDRRAWNSYLDRIAPPVSKPPAPTPEPQHTDAMRARPERDLAAGMASLKEAIDDLGHQMRGGRRPPGLIFKEIVDLPGAWRAGGFRRARV